MIDELIKENQNLKEALKIALARNAQLEEQLKTASKRSSKLEKKATKAVISLFIQQCLEQVLFTCTIPLS